MAIGRAPTAGTGKNLQDSDWLLGLAGGDNSNCQDVVALAGGAQAGAPVIGGVVNGLEATLIRIKTCVTNLDSLQLPQAIHGRELSVYNSTAQTCNIFASPNTNKATGALDTINGVANATAFTAAALATTGTGVYFFCPADGVWAASRSS